MVTPSLEDLNFNAWSIDMVYRWNFAPGSEMNIVWKNQLFQETRLGDFEQFALPDTYSRQLQSDD